MLIEEYNKLSPVDKEALVIAFNEHQTFLIMLSDDFFIGVWIIPSECLRVIETENDWYYGEKICPTA